MTKYFLNRIQKLQKLLDEGGDNRGGGKNSDQAILLTKPTDVTYFTNFPQLVPEEREAYFLCTANKSWIFHHSFSPSPLSFDSLTLIPKAHLPEIVKVLSRLKKVKELLVDGSDLTFKEFKYLEESTDLKINQLNRRELWELRQVKDDLELELMAKAGKIINLAFKKAIKKDLRVGITEIELAARLDFETKKLGAEMPAFPTIVAFGENGALPHHQPTDKKLEKEMPVLIDAGARFQGYRSDMTRSFWFGDKPSAKFKKVEKIVKTAYELGLTKLENSLNVIGKLPSAKQLDKVVRDYITKQGYGKEFLHTTGHGLGLDIHEPPSISWRNESRLLAGMTVTIEPGIYLDGKFGYRYENTVCLGENGVKILTK